MLETKLKIPSGIHGQTCRVGADHDVVQEGTHPGARGGKRHRCVGGAPGEPQNLRLERIRHRLPNGHVLGRLAGDAHVQASLHRRPAPHLELHQKRSARPAQIQRLGGDRTHRRGRAQFGHPARAVDAGHRQEVAVTCP